MCNRFGVQCHPRRFFILTNLIFILMATVVACFGAAQAEESPGQPLVSKEDAAQMIMETVVKNLTESSDLKMGLRVNQFPELLDAGTRVGEANEVDTMPSEVLVCRNASWLFFLDLAPDAHFGHPVIIAAIDAVSGDIQTMDAQWWPVLMRPVFDDVAQRQDPDTIIFEKEPEL
ncbi:MAG: hypothetical protein A4E45_00433 [Methanosaeta sp. PtaB.Bin039]|nr:MAG: hypothetical protein A4E45_00433 [Methanosaeta sp. PtaB.Bin039]